MILSREVPPPRDSVPQRWLFHAQHTMCLISAGKSLVPLLTGCQRFWVVFVHGLLFFVGISNRRLWQIAMSTMMLSLIKQNVITEAEKIGNRAARSFSFNKANVRRWQKGTPKLHSYAANTGIFKAFEYLSE